MKKNGQASLEYLLMVVIAIVIILMATRHFFDPRFGAIKKTGTLQGTIEDAISKSMCSKMEG